jgi:hypothetical protein
LELSPVVLNLALKMEPQFVVEFAIHGGAAE